MNADGIRHFYNYHFTINRAIWDHCIMELTDEQFLQDVQYSLGSVKNQVVHLMSVDEAWFCDIRGIEFSEHLHPQDLTTREEIRHYWNRVETDMRQYLARLTDDMLMQKPIAEGEDKDLFLWQILLHVVNHGTDHRAQLLRLLHDYGIKTPPQDYIFYVYDHP
jgi:uncharacterized damage-inducible protein DinB